jgi:hypothetical protein
LLLALQRDDEPDLCLSIEKLDDVALHDDADFSLAARKLRQYKLHVNRQGGLGDKSTDIWKTLRVWAEAVVARRIDLDRVRLCLVTTSEASERHAVSLLGPDPSGREPEKARLALEKSGAESKSPVVSVAYATLSKLSVPDRKKLFSSIYLFSGSIDAARVQAEIARCLWSACLPQHRDAFINRLEGWWVDLVVRHLSEPDPVPNPISLVQQKVHEIRCEFDRDRLPDDLLGASIPERAIDDTDNSLFVRQLLLVAISQARVRLAQEDHYRAFTQRSRWVKDKLVDLGEVIKYEGRLIGCWRERFLIMLEEVPPESDEHTLVRHGAALFNWVVVEAPSRSQLWFRPEFQSEYMTKGSYHMLADQLRVGWHPKYQDRLSFPIPSVPNPPAPSQPVKQRRRAAR